MYRIVYGLFIYSMRCILELFISCQNIHRLVLNYIGYFILLILYGDLHDMNKEFFKRLIHK